MSGQRALLLVGSPRPQGRSASESLGSYVCEQLASHGIESSMFRIPYASKEAGVRRLLAALDDADVFVLATPLYVDALPYLVTRALERIAAHRADPAAGRACRMLAVVNCGFPEAEHTSVALEICRIFAGRARFEWAGGLGLGGGEAITGLRLQDSRWLASNIMRALDMAAAALAAHEPLPAQAAALMAKPLMHPRVYTSIAATSWYQRAWRNGVVTQLRARPLAGTGST
jgi:hypothetical protein